MKKYLLSLAMSFSLIATTAFAVDVSELENLEPYFEKQGLQISKYKKVLIAPLGVDATYIIPPPWVTGADANPKRWSLTEDDVRWLHESYYKAVSTEIGQEFEVVDQPGDGVLIVHIELISLMPFARKGEDVQTQGFGVVVAQAQLRDGKNGELLAVYEGPQRVGHEYQQNTRLNAETSLTNLFEIWGARMRLYMESHVD